MGVKVAVEGVVVVVMEVEGSVAVDEGEEGGSFDDPLTRLGAGGRRAGKGWR